jgi:hypothetical protein
MYALRTTQAPMEYEENLNFIRDKFIAINQNPHKYISTHVTSAHTLLVFNAVKNSIIQALFFSAGIL